MVTVEIRDGDKVNVVHVHAGNLARSMCAALETFDPFLSLRIYGGRLLAGW